MRCHVFLLALLVYVQATAAYDVPNPFSWKAVEDAERQAVTHVASLYDDSVRLKQRVIERVFAPESAGPAQAAVCEATPEPTVVHRSSCGTTCLIMLLAAVAAAFCFGWVLGSRQSLAQQAMQQARAADQAEICRLEQAENASSTPSAENSAAHRVTQPDSGQQVNASEGSAVRAASLSSVESESSAADHPVSSQHQVRSQDADSSSPSSGSASWLDAVTDDQLQTQQQQQQLGQQQQAQQHHSHQQASQQHQQVQQQQHPEAAEVRSAAQPNHAPAHNLTEDQPSGSPELHQTSQPSQTGAAAESIQPAAQQAVQGSTSSSRHTAGNAELTPPASAPQQPMQPPSTGTELIQQEPAVLQPRPESNVADIASRMVHFALQGLGLDAQQLSRQERLGLMPAAVNAIGIVQGHVDNMMVHRLMGVSNQQGAEHNSILREGLQDRRAWRQADEEQRQLQLFISRLADCLLCGLIVMLGGMLYWGTTLGYYEGRLSECKGSRSGFFGHLFSPWQAIQFMQTVWCYTSALADLIGSVLLIGFVPLMIKKYGLLRDSMTQPMTCLIVGLGLVCGLIGQYAVSRVGGDRWAWLLAYWLWVSLHVCSVWCIQSLYRYLNSDGLSQHVLAVLKLPVYYVVMGVGLPLVVAACPFWRLSRLLIRV